MRNLLLALSLLVAGRSYAQTTRPLTTDGADQIARPKKATSSTSTKNSRRMTPESPPMPATPTPSAASVRNVLDGDQFDPAKWLEVPARTFEDLKVGEVFRGPSRTLTAAHTAAFQLVSMDTHPRHYNDDYAKAHGMPAALIQPFEVLSFTAPGATLFTHYVGEQIVALSEVSCKFVKDSYVGDTLYPALEIADLSTEGANGVVTMNILVYNQRGEQVLIGQQKFLLKRSASAMK